MADRPATLYPGGVLLDRRGAAMVLMALELLRRSHHDRNGGPALSADFEWLYQVCQAGARSSGPVTIGRSFTAYLPSSAAMVTVAEAAAIRGVTPHAITKAIRAGRLPAQRHGQQWLLSEYEVRRLAGGRRRNGDDQRSQPGHDPGRSPIGKDRRPQRTPVGGQGRSG